jgi:putative thioredoxin
LATLGMSAADREAVEAFKRDVIEPSMNALVILDFWAEWCGPCKQLSPVLEKVAAAYANRGVTLVKVNVDEQKLIAAQFRVQSIPTVYAVFQGQLVADLTSARTEGALGQILDQLLRQLPIQGEEDALHEDVAPLVAMGEEVLESGDVERALSIFSQLSEMAPDDPAVIAGHARALLAAGQPGEAEALLDAVPEDKAKDPGIARARAALALAGDAAPADDLGGLRDRVAADPDDQEARYELAGALMSQDRDEAAELLLGSIERDREWNEGAARKRLLTLFEATGLEDFGRSIRLMLKTGTRLSIFPLGGALLLPRGFLPLYIFEPRYRALVSDALARDRKIAMIQPLLGQEDEARPGLFGIGCVGKIEHVEALSDGCFNLILRGLTRFRLLSENDVSTPFRQVMGDVESFAGDAIDPDPLPSVVRADIEEAARIFVDAHDYRIDWDDLERLDDEALVNGLSQAIPFDILAKQALLEADDLPQRADMLAELLRFSAAGDEDGSTLQ